MFEINKILYPTDFSENAKHALKYGTSFASDYGATLYVLFVIDKLLGGSDFKPLSITVEDIYQGFKNEVEKLIKNEIPEKLRSEIEVVDLIGKGSPSEEIVKVAREQKIDLIVMATHGRTGLTHTVLGSTTEKVIRSAPCPVLAVKHPEHEFVMP